MDTYFKALIFMAVMGTSSTSTKTECSGTYQGSTYCNFYPGDADTKIVIIAPHGGDLKPPNIKTRDAGCYVNGDCVWNHTCGTKDMTRCKAVIFKDLYTKEISQLLLTELHKLTGHRPHLVVNELHRSKFDGNRGINEATFGENDASKAFTEFHQFITDAKAAIKGRGLVIDMHGQTHSHGLNELGYLLNTTALNTDTLRPEESSIRHLAGQVKISFDDLVRGLKSLGQFLEDEGYATIPSSTNKKPNSLKYYSGGYNTKTYGSQNGGEIDSIQIETHRKYRSKDPAPAYAAALARALNQFMVAHGYTANSSSEKFKFHWTSICISIMVGIAAYML